MDKDSIKRDIKKTAAAGTIAVGGVTRVASFAAGATLAFSGLLTKSTTLTKVGVDVALNVGDEAGKAIMETGNRLWKEADETDMT